MPENQINKIYENLKDNLNFSFEDLETVIKEGSNYIKITNLTKKNNSELIFSEKAIKNAIRKEIRNEKETKKLESGKNSLETTSYNKAYNSNNSKYLETETNRIHDQIPFTTLEDIVIILLATIKTNHSTDSIRMREQRLLKKFTELEIDQFAKMNLQKKRELLARRFNGKTGERIKLSLKQEEIIERLERQEKLLNKLCNKPSNQ